MAFIYLPPLHDDPRVISIPPRHRGPAVALLVMSAGWAHAQVTAGRVPTVIARHFGASDRAIAELVRSGLVEATDDGFQIADWQSYAAGEGEVGRQ